MTRGQATAYRTKIIEADEVKADLLVVASYIPKGQRKNSAQSLSASWQSMNNRR